MALSIEDAAPANAVPVDLVQANVAVAVLTASGLAGNQAHQLEQLRLPWSPTIVSFGNRM